MATIQVLGCLIKQPMLLLDEKYRLDIEDFPERFHQILYGCIDNLVKQGVQDINSINIDDYLSKFPRQHKVFEDNKGMEYVENAVDLAQIENFDYYYQTFRKFGLLNQLQKKGFDTTIVYDPNVIDVDQQAEMQRQFDRLSVQDIFTRYELSISELKEVYDSSSESTGVQAADGMMALKEQYKEAPEMGMPFNSGVMTTIARGRRLKKFYLKSAPSGFGKALPNDSLIPTPNGWRKVGDIKVGDYLFGQDGKPTKVLNVFPQGEKQVWEVHFKDGRAVPCCEDHLWEYYNARVLTGKPLVESTKEIYRKANKFGFKCFNGMGYRYSIRTNNPVSYPEKALYPNPYVMGALLGNGCFRLYKANGHEILYYSSENEEMPNRIASILGENITVKKVKKNYSYYFKDENHALWVIDILKNYPELWNLKSRDKFIPKDYLESSIEQRFSLLQGLLDTDGCIEKNKGTISYSTTSEKLRDNLIELCRSLGMSVTFYEQERDGYNVWYNMQIICSKEIKPKLFRLKRKKDIAEKYSQNKKRTKRRDRIEITNIIPTNSFKEMTCFVVDNEDHLFLANDFIVTHNSRVSLGDAARISIPYYYDTNTREWLNTGCSSPTLFITTELEVDEIQSLIMAYVSGVPEEHILDGNYKGDEENRVDKAIELIGKSPLFIEQIPNFDIEDIENAIKKYKLKYQVGYVFFDYLFSSIKILSEVAGKTKGVKLREDNVLLMFADRMKTLANTLNVHIDTSTQVNGEWRNVREADMNIIRSSKAVADKVDLGMILLPVSEADRLGIESIVARTQGFLPDPNLVFHIYKNRRGKLNHVRLFIYFDYSTCRTTDLFVTDNKYNLIDVESTLVDFKRDYEEDVDYVEEAVEEPVIETPEILEEEQQQPSLDWF